MKVAKRAISSLHWALAPRTIVTQSGGTGSSSLDGALTSLPNGLDTSSGSTSSGRVPNQREQDGNVSYNAAEVGKFSALAKQWWDPKGPMAPLHSMNPIRVKVIRKAICDRHKRDVHDVQPLRGLEVADIGSGAGLLSESLARLGAKVLGIDASRDVVQVAREHSDADHSIRHLLQYREGTAKQLVAQGASFDAVIASEVIEHVPNPDAFCGALASLARQQGCVLISTLNRTPKSYALAILAAEKLLAAVPEGTHDWNKFITPDELTMMMRDKGLRLDSISGMSISPLQPRWALSTDLAVNYFAAFSPTE